MSGALLADNIPASDTTTTEKNNNPAQSLQDRSRVPDIEEQVRLEVESRNPTGGIVAEVRRIPRDRINQAQELIASAVSKNETVQNDAINRATRPKRPLHLAVLGPPHPNDIFISMIYSVYPH